VLLLKLRSNPLERRQYVLSSSGFVTADSTQPTAPPIGRFKLAPINLFSLNSAAITETSVLAAKSLVFSQKPLSSITASSYHWTSIDAAELETGDLIYKARTASGETFNFRSHPGSSGVFNGEEICGINENGAELILGLTEVSEVELAAWDPMVPYLVCGGLSVLIIYLAVELNSEGAPQAPELVVSR